MNRLSRCTGAALLRARALALLHRRLTAQAAAAWPAGTPAPAAARVFFYGG